MARQPQWCKHTAKQAGLKQQLAWIQLLSLDEHIMQQANRGINISTERAQRTCVARWHGGQTHKQHNTKHISNFKKNALTVCSSPSGPSPRFTGRFVKMATIERPTKTTWKVLHSIELSLHLKVQYVRIGQLLNSCRKQKRATYHQGNRVSSVSRILPGLRAQSTRWVLVWFTLLAQQLWIAGWRRFSGGESSKKWVKTRWVQAEIGETGSGTGRNYSIGRLYRTD